MINERGLNSMSRLYLDRDDWAEVTSLLCRAMEDLEDKNPVAAVLKIMEADNILCSKTELEEETGNDH